MKKLVLTALVLATLALTACGASFNATETTTSNTSTGELPIQTQLLLGSLRLNDSERPITATQAAELLPLWQVYQELLTSDTAAQEEMNALVDQIQETMTAEQLQAIEAMNLTQDDLALAIQEQGVTSSASQIESSTAMVSAPQGAPSGDMPAGEMPVGDMGGDMGVIAGSAPASNSETLQPQMVGAFPSRLIDILVQLLESKVV